MPSPSPGMDSYPESPRLFKDLHDSLVFAIKERFQTSRILFGEDPIRPAPRPEQAEWARSIVKPG